MTLLEIAKRLEKLTIDNSPAILTAIGVTGTLTTAFLTGKASFKAADILREEEYKVAHGYIKDCQLQTKEKFIVVWKLYIPAIGTGVLTVTCIIFANRIGTRRAAGLAAAYTISEKAFVEYREKVIEKFGENKERAVRDEVAQDRINRSLVSDREVVIIGDGEVLCFDAFSGRYFNSTMETLKKAQNDINYTILSDSYASLGDFYGRVGLSTTPYSEEVGWTTDLQCELKFSTILSDDQRPCISIDFRKAPVRDYHKLY